MRALCLIALLIGASVSLYAQDEDSVSRSGEIRNAEVIIEKERKLALPAANRLFQTSEIKETTEEPPVIRFNIQAPRVTVPQFVPKFEIRPLEKGNRDQLYHTEAQVAFGNYLSPLLSITHHQQRDNMTYGAQFFHESFLEGPVRNEESGSSSTRANAQASWQLSDAQANLGVRFNRSGFYYYGLSDEAFVSSEDRFITGRAHIQDFQVSGGITGKAMDNKFSYEITPQFSYVDAGENGSSSFANETDFDLNSAVDYRIDANNQVGLEFTGLFSTYESGASQNRSVLSFEPWYRTRVKVIDFKVGFQANAISDSSSSTQVGAIMELGIPLGGSWKIEGGIDNRIRFNRMLDLYQQNLYLDDSLSLQTSVVKVPFYGRVRGTVLPNLEVVAGVEIRDIENAHYFKPSLVDSSRFLLTYDSASLNVFTYRASLSYTLDPSLQLKAGFRFFDYSPGSEAEAWYRPTSVFSLEGRKRMGKWLLTGRLKVVDGITAPSPVTSEPVALKGFSDLSLKVDYRLGEQAAVYLQAENILNRSYAYYLNYPTRRMAFKAGFRYRF